MKKELFERYPSLRECEKSIDDALGLLVSCYENGGKLLVCGNGGSCADSEHIVGELMKGFLKKRPVPPEKREMMKKNCPGLDGEIIDRLQCGLPAVALTGADALNTAFCNDVSPELVFAQSVFGLGKTGDILIGISTSGNSANVVCAVKVAKALGLKTVALTGKNGGKLAEIADVSVCVPETETFKVQELHLPVYHYLCAALEDRFFRI